MSRTILRGATAIDPRDGERTERADIVLDGDTVVDVSHGPIAAESDARLVDVSGRYVVPGFEEMHAHPYGRAVSGVHPLMVAYGVTGVRQMSGSFELLRARREGRLPAPEIAPALLEMPGAVLTPVNAGNPGQARATVREQVAAGADFIKAAFVSAEVFEAAQEEALGAGVGIAGHMPEGLDIPAASRRGLRAIEHLGPGVPLLGCCSGRPAGEPVDPPRLPLPASPRVTGLLERVAAPMMRRIVVNPALLSTSEGAQTLRDLATHLDPQRVADLAGRLAEDGTWQVPTLVRLQAQYLCDQPELHGRPELRYVSAKALSGWSTSTRRFQDKFSADDRAAFREAYLGFLDLTRMLDEAGVPLLAGSDVCGGIGLVPGAALHDEMDQLARAGLAPLRVLQLATSEAGRFLGQSDRIGRVTKGAAADLVVLRSDPTESSAALHEIDVVVLRGRVLDRAALDGLLEDAAQERPGF